MPGTVKSGLLSDADRSHKCDSQGKVCWWHNLPLDKGHFITADGHHSHSVTPPYERRQGDLKPQTPPTKACKTGIFSGMRLKHLKQKQNIRRKWREPHLCIEIYIPFCRSVCKCTSTYTSTVLYYHFQMAIIISNHPHNQDNLLL